MNKAIFIDRDGVINKMIKYSKGWDSPQSSDDVILVKGIDKIISWANMQNVTVVEVSNQPGVAKGKMNQKTSDEIEKKIHQMLNKHDAVVNSIYVCPHHPEAVIPELKKVCECRKPKSGLLIKAANELEIVLSESVIIGDKVSDIEAGRAVGCGTIIFLHSDDSDSKVREVYKSKADYKIFRIEEALPILKKIFKSG